MAGKRERIEEILTSLQQSGTSARETTLSLEALLAELRSDSVMTRFDDIKTGLEATSKAIESRSNELSEAIEKKSDELLELIRGIKEKAASDSKNILTQHELLSSKLQLVEERTTARLKSQWMLLVITSIFGFSTLVVMVLFLTKL